MEEYSINNKHKVKEVLQKDGFIVIKNGIPLKELEIIQQYASDYLNVNRNEKEILLAMEKLENSNKKAFFEFCSEMGNIPPVLKIALNDKLFDLAKYILGINEIYLTDWGVFFNKQTVKRLQYDWHQEKAYFPNAEQVITVWFPWLTNVSEKNGTMIMAKGGNKKIFNAKRIPQKNGLTQMRIKDIDLSAYEKKHCELNLGDFVIFDLYSPHRTGFNSTGIPRTTMLFRYTDKIGKFNHGWVKSS
tara:strand:- start:3653 stop:4387 length:735 start_codon:yes stop_codon:yes gene_type:complete